jgi:membrane protease YdiL (CAAX protease family)
MNLRLFRKLRWPAAGLGLGTPLNSALATAAGRARFARAAWLYVLAGIGMAGAMIDLDRVLFAGVSRQRIRMMGGLPFLTRLEIVLESAIAEEIVFRLVLSTLVAWFAARVLSRRGPRSQPAAIWIGIVTAAVLFGLAHVANLPDVPHPYLRAIVLNGVAGIALGWLYWYRGLESAMVAHLAADATIYLALARATIYLTHQSWPGRVPVWTP